MMGVRMKKIIQFTSTSGQVKAEKCMRNKGGHNCSCNFYFWALSSLLLVSGICADLNRALNGGSPALAEKTKTRITYIFPVNGMHLQICSFSKTYFSTYPVARYIQSSSSLCSNQQNKFFPIQLIIKKVQRRILRNLSLHLHFRRTKEHLLMNHRNMEMSPFDIYDSSKKACWNRG